MNCVKDPFAPVRAFTTVRSYLRFTLAGFYIQLYFLTSTTYF